MIFYAQRVEASRGNPLAASELASMWDSWGIILERLFENLLKVWIGVEYVHDRDFWRRRFYTNYEEQIKQVQGGLITTYAPTYLYFAGSEDGKTLIDVIALDKRSFDGAMTALSQSEQTITTKSLSLDHFPDNAAVEAFYTVDYSTKTEQMIGFDAARAKKDVLPPASQSHRYFSVTFATDFSLANDTRLIAIGWEETGFALNIVEKDQIAEPLREENQTEFIKLVSSLLGNLHQDPDKICTKRV